MAEEHVEDNPGEEGPVPVLRWDLGLFEQIVRSFRFPLEWDARYRGQNQTAADAPPGYITLFEDFFLQGNFWLPATNFMGSILHFYNFHISQMSPPEMVRVRHFEFLCRAHGIEPTVEKFRAFYQLIRNMGFFSFASRGAARKILLNPPKSFHDWKPKFFFIREEVLPIAMPFRDWTEPILKEDLPIPKHERWYQQLTPTPNRVFGENVLVAARMSDRWLPDIEEVPILKINDQGVLRNLGIDPEDKKKKKPVKKKKVITLDPEVTSKGAGSSRATSTVADKGTLRLRQSNLEDYIIISDSFEGLSRLGEKKIGAGGSKSSGSASSRNPDAGTTPSSVAQEGDDEEEAQEEPAVKLIRKRSREAALGATVLPKPGDAPLIGKKSNLRSLYKFSPGIVFCFLVLTIFSFLIFFFAEAEKKKTERGMTITEPLELAQKKTKATKVTIKPFTSSHSAEKEKQKGPEKPVRVEREKPADKPPKEPEITIPITTDTAQGSGPTPVIRHDQPITEKGKNLGVEQPVEPSPTAAPVQTGPATTEQATAAAGGSAGFVAGQASAGSGGRRFTLL
ncbi:hypothetical protein HanRHA438_Chr10g0438421 [Helianthus annuus]|nr:hypothetical protein HanRHA438_Chr10g0438421 [Helianthus annuus]KAJ0882572.1 hypothetical protein HanPSC8_Chr10g0411191 [Helianthus annuus]